MMSDVNGKSVLITGTTSGIGRALLEHYAKNGVKAHLPLQNSVVADDV